MFTTELVNLYNRNIFKTSLYIYIFQDEKCRLSLSMVESFNFLFKQTRCAVCEVNAFSVKFRYAKPLTTFFCPKRICYKFRRSFDQPNQQIMQTFIYTYI